MILLHDHHFVDKMYPFLKTTSGKIQGDKRSFLDGMKKIMRKSRTLTTRVTEKNQNLEGRLSQPETENEITENQTNENPSAQK